MTARLDISHQEDKKGLDVQMTQLTDAAGVSVLVSDITGGNIASGTFAGAVSAGTTLSVTGASTLGGAVDMDSTLQVDGQATFSVMPLLPRTTVAATGSTVSDAAPITPSVCTVTAANATKGVVLVTAPPAGTWYLIKNIDAANAILKVYPDASATINAIGSNGPISMAAKTAMLIWADSTTQWYTLPLLPS